MNISHNERRAHFHTFPLLYLFYSVCFYHGRSTLCLLPSLALPPSPTPRCSPSRAGCVPAALLAPSGGGIPPRRGAGSLGQGEQQREAKNPSSKGRGGRQVASERQGGKTKSREQWELRGAPTLAPLIIRPSPRRVTRRGCTPHPPSQNGGGMAGGAELGSRSAAAPQGGYGPVPRDRAPPGCRHVRRDGRSPATTWALGPSPAAAGESYRLQGWGSL